MSQRHLSSQVFIKGMGASLRHEISNLGASLRHEISNLCSNDTLCILRSKTSSSLKEFQCEKLLNEAEELAPTLIQLLYCCTTKTHRKEQNAIIGVLLAILCKHRRPISSLFQRHISHTLLWAYIKKGKQCLHI